MPTNFSPEAPYLLKSNSCEGMNEAAPDTFAGGFNFSQLFPAFVAIIPIPLLSPLPFIFALGLLVPPAISLVKPLDNEDNMLLTPVGFKRLGSLRGTNAEIHIVCTMLIIIVISTQLF